MDQNSGQNVPAAAAEDLQGARPRTTFGLKSAILGMILGIDAAGHCIALATLCFAGALTAGLGLASAAFMAGSAAITFALACFSQFRVAVGISQDTSIAILAPAVVLAGMSVSGPAEAQVLTGMAVIGTSAIVSGAAFWLVGRRGLGRVVRLFPYPVSAGFLASSGYLLVAAAIAMLVGPHSDTLLSAGAYLTREILWSLLPALALAFALLLAMRFSASATPIVALIAIFVAGFYGALSFAGLDLDAARDLHLLPDLERGGAFDWRALSPGLIDWSIVAVAGPTIAAVVLINLIAILLNTSGVELALKEDIDVNRELRVTGLVNLAIGLFGGLTAFLQGGSTVIAGKTRAERWPLALGYSSVLVAGCFFASQIVAVLPSFVAAGLLIFIGASMLDDWLLAMRHRLLRSDWAIVGGIVLVTAFAGILPAIAVGLSLAVLSFAVAYARLPVIRNIADGRLRRSVVDRPAAAEDILSRDGASIQILHLQGALFFGSVERLKEDILKLIEMTPDIRFLILDLSEVNTIDSAACVALEKLRQVLSRRGISAAMTNLSEDHRRVFGRWGLALHEGSAKQARSYAVWSALDDALEHFEDVLIGERGTNAVLTVEELLNDLSKGHPRVPDLIGKMTRYDLSEGEVLIEKGARSGDVFFLQSGHLVVRLINPEGVQMRVRSMGPGAIVGEIAHFLDLPRSAVVVAANAAVAFGLSAEAIDAMAQDDRDLIALLYQILARALATKIVQTNSLLTNFQSNRSLMASLSASKPD